MSNDDVHVVTIEDRAKEIIMATALNVCKNTFIEKIRRYLSQIYYRIDCINSFVHREMNLKNRIAHIMKDKSLHKKVCGSVFFFCSSRNES